jgi:hypothetical protein
MLYYTNVYNQDRKGLSVDSAINWMISEYSVVLHFLRTEYFLILSSHLHLLFPSGTFSSDFSNNSVYIFITSPRHVTRCAPLYAFNFITLIIVSDYNKVQNCNYSSISVVKFVKYLHLGFMQFCSRNISFVPTRRTSCIALIQVVPKPPSVAFHAVSQMQLDKKRTEML